VVLVVLPPLCTCCVPASIISPVTVLPDVTGVV
jgi:hypothetical protein